MRRLTFVVRKGVVELLSEQVVDMKAIAEHKVPHTARHAFWYELRDADDKTLSSHPAPDPIADDIELFSDDPVEGMSRLPHQPNETAFTVVLPDAAGADSVVLMRAPTVAGPAPAGALAAPAPTTTNVVARFKLSKS